jgi:hypothetical protein
VRRARPALRSSPSVPVRACERPGRRLELARAVADASTGRRRSSRCHKEFKLNAASGGDGGSSGSGNDNSGGGGGGGDGKGDGEEPEEEKPKGGFFWKGWQDRVAFDPEFPFKVLLEQVRSRTRNSCNLCMSSRWTAAELVAARDGAPPRLHLPTAVGKGPLPVEQQQRTSAAALAPGSSHVDPDHDRCLPQVIGVGASVIGDMSSRPNWGLNELDFVFSTAVVRGSRDVECRIAGSWPGRGGLRALPRRLAGSISRPAALAPRPIAHALCCCSNRACAGGQHHELLAHVPAGADRLGGRIDGRRLHLARAERADAQRLGRAR